MGKIYKQKDEIPLQVLADKLIMDMRRKIHEKVKVLAKCRWFTILIIDKEHFNKGD